MPAVVPPPGRQLDFDSSCIDVSENRDTGLVPLKEVRTDCASRISSADLARVSGKGVGERTGRDDDDQQHLRHILDEPPHPSLLRDDLLEQARRDEHRERHHADQQGQAVGVAEMTEEVADFLLKGRRGAVLGGEAGLEAEDGDELRRKDGEGDGRHEATQEGLPGCESQLYRYLRGTVRAAHPRQDGVEKAEAEEAEPECARQ